jgi:hypothetical protein
VIKLRKVRADNEIPRKTSDPLVKANIEEIKATTQKANKGKKVLGKRRRNRSGIVTRMHNSNNGNSDSGRTKVSPPKPPGKKGKLVTGNVTRSNTQAIVTALFSSQIPFFLFILFYLIGNAHQFYQ